MELKFVLDFDGVLFNSAFEAYSVCNQATQGCDGFRQNVGFKEFLEYRSVVTDAWQYNLLYSEDRQIEDIQTLPERTPEEVDWAFARDFFAARAAMMGDPEWPKVMAPYDFFFLIKPLLLADADRFAILSTRNVESIRRTMAFFDSDVVRVFGQEDIRKLGSKVKVAEAEGWLCNGDYLVVYVDDMNAHLEPFEGRVHLPLHANWGYDQTDANSLSSHQIVTIIRSMLKLANPAHA